ncbi:MAG TPA: hypothetical protein VGL38_06050 [bacterium]|jgi:hypothetical protein
MKRHYFCTGWLLIVSIVYAQPQSEHFRMLKSATAGGGRASASERFRMTAVYGQSTPPGRSRGAVFQMNAGFLTPLLSVSTLSPIQRLILQPQAPNVWLYWEPVPGAHSYAVHADSTMSFLPRETNLLGTTMDTVFVDVNPLGGPSNRRFYSVIPSTVPLRAVGSTSNTSRRVSRHPY